MRTTLPGPTTSVESTTTGGIDVTTSEEDITIPATINSVTGKSIADLEQELQDLENQYEEYNEYNLPADEKVMGGQATTPANHKTLVTLKSGNSKSISRVTPIIFGKTSLGGSMTKGGTVQVKAGRGSFRAKNPSTGGVIKRDSSSKAPKPKGYGKP